MKKTFYLILINITTALQADAQCWQNASVSFHTLAIKSNGTLWAWGYNADGQFGNGTNVSSNTPAQIGTATDWDTVVAGDRHSLALKTNGTLWAWGYNSSGQLGDGTNTDKNIPVQIGTDNDWIFIAEGGASSFAIKTNGTLWAWGANFWGQLGDGTNSDKNIPVQVGTDNNWLFIAPGAHCLALKTNGTIWTWGYNSFGQLGNGTTTNTNSPAQLGTDNNWVAIATGGGHSIAIKNNGALWAWGWNTAGQVGDGTNINKTTPVQIGSDLNWSKIDGGDFHTLAIKNNGTLWAWGSNSSGELGIGTWTSVNLPHQIGVQTYWLQVTATSNSSGAVTTATVANLWLWGRNDLGQVGNGTNTDINTPFQINCIPVLPVTWLYINGKLQNNTTIIEWATASESNSSHFEIEHSSNGIDFTKAGAVNAAGFSSSTSNYSFTHLSLTAGKNYYRIKQIDINGRFTYSSIIVLQNIDNSSSHIIAPNPVQTEAILYFKEPGSKTIQLFNMNGILLHTEKINGTINRHAINMINMASGIYLLHIITVKGNETYKIIKQ